MEPNNMTTVIYECDCCGYKIDTSFIEEAAESVLYFCPKCDNAYLVFKHDRTRPVLNVEKYLNPIIRENRNKGNSNGKD